MHSVRGYLLLLMLLAVKASHDHGMLQRQAELPLDFLDMLRQRPVVSHPDVTQKGITPYSVDQSVPFPLARPNMNNILAICQYSNLRPRYTKDMLPRNGFGYLHRRTDAINRLESWFTVCCSTCIQDDEMILCCAQKAWERSLSVFCEEEFSIKTSHYHCCKKHGPARWDCFEKEAPDPLYQPSEDKVLTVLPPTIQGFAFNPSSCQKSSVSEINSSQQEMVTKPQTSRWLGQGMQIPQIPLPVPLYTELLGEPVFSPRSTRPSITFPLAPPTTTNIHAICQYSNQRPRYPKEALPTSGYGSQYRQAIAVNELESWYTVCCTNGYQDNEQTLCCAQQAWVKSLVTYCEEEFMVKTSQYYCCRMNGLEKWHCFENVAKNISYHPSGQEVLTMPPPTIQGFNFDPSRCQSTSISEVVSRVVMEEAKKMKPEFIGFPPGRPHSENIKGICEFHEYRPQHLTKCFLNTGFDYDRFAHHLKAMDSIEKRYGQCCKKNKDAHICAEEKWKKMVDRFCKDEKKVQENQFKCCKKQRGEERYDCFNTAAPNQSYMVMAEPVRLFSHLNMFCDMYPVLQHMKHLPFSVDEIAANCCILVENTKRSECIHLKLENLVDDACNTDDPSLAKVKQDCCKKTGTKRVKCITKLLLPQEPMRCPIIL